VWARLATIAHFCRNSARAHPTPAVARLGARAPGLPSVHGAIARAHVGVAISRVDLVKVRSIGVSCDHVIPSTVVDSEHIVLTRVVGSNYIGRGINGALETCAVMVVVPPKSDAIGNLVQASMLGIR
jgi:hypothetical protein